MEQEFESDNILLSKVGIFINPTPNAGEYRCVVAIDDGTGTLKPFNSISFIATRQTLREFNRKLELEISLSSNLVHKQVHPKGNEDRHGTILGIMAASDTVQVVWHDGLHKTFECIDDLVVIN